MDKWNTDIALRVVARAKIDEFYQELLHECEEKAEVYHRIMDLLSEEEREQVDDYIGLCEELEHRMTRLAYEVGLVDGAKSIN